MVNSIIEGKYKGLRKAKDRFYLEISDSQLCDFHFQELTSLIKKIENIILEMSINKISLTFDIAIEPEDRNTIYGNVMHISPDYLLVLGKYGINLEISEYK